MVNPQLSRTAAPAASRPPAAAAPPCSSAAARRPAGLRNAAAPDGPSAAPGR